MSSSNEFYFEPCTSEELDNMLADRHRKQNTNSIVAKTKKKLGKVAKECAAAKKEKVAKREKDKKKFKIDLSGEPERSPLLKSDHEGDASKYVGVGVNSGRKEKPWRGDAYINGKKTIIGTYKTEEEAGIAVAKAIFKYGTERQKKKFGLTAGDESRDAKYGKKKEGKHQEAVTKQKALEDKPAATKGGNAATKKKKSAKMQREEIQQILEDMENNSSNAANEKTKKRSAAAKQRDGKAKRRRM